VRYFISHSGGAIYSQSWSGLSPPFVALRSGLFLQHSPIIQAVLVLGIKKLSGISSNGIDAQRIIRDLMSTRLQVPDDVPKQSPANPAVLLPLNDCTEASQLTTRSPRIGYGRDSHSDAASACLSTNLGPCF
jgi:hypothetical protein